MPRSLNDIIPPSRRKQAAPITDMRNTTPVSAPPPQQRASGGFPYGTALFALIIIAGSIAALFYFSGAKVEVTPKTQTVSVDASFSATPNAGDLPYKVVTVEKIGTQTVKAESTAEAHDSAQGTITVMNAQSVPQTLINNTRFESSNGLIFKIHAPITVPAGSPEAPGTVSAVVYADKPGADYNIPAGSFTVPGLKGGKAYTLVTAKSAAPMAGGFSGQRPSVGEATRKAQIAKIQAALEGEVQASLKEQLPEGYVLIGGASNTQYLPQSDKGGENGVTISVKGTATSVAFPANALAKAIAYKALTPQLYNGEDISLLDASGLTISGPASSTPSGTQTYTFSLKGDATLVWSVDTAKIAGAVAGKKRGSAQSILTGFNEIDKAILVLRPFFAGSFPNDPAKIQVTITEPKAPGSSK